jgi:hypothetical protein
MRLFRLIPLVLAAGLLAPAAGADREGPSDAQATLRAARPARVAPTRIVFAAIVAYNGGQSQIYSVEPSGRGTAQLTFGSESASAPLPSPDGRSIAFERGSSIWLMRPNGNGQRLLVKRGLEPAWAPDSRRIAYVSGTKVDRLGIGVVRVEGAGSRVLVRGDVYSPRWSPDGHSLVFLRATGGPPVSYAVAVVRGGKERIVAANSSSSSVPVWSADGRWLAYTATLNGPGELVVVRPDGRGQRVVDAGSDPVWSPRGERLAYVGSGELRVFDEPSSSRRTLARGDYIDSLAWSPSGQAIAFGQAAMFSEGGIVSALKLVTLAGRVRVLDHGESFPVLPRGVAWTTSPPGLHYRPPQPRGPLAEGDELRLREPVEDLAADGDRVAYRFCGTVGVWRPGDLRVVTVRDERPLCPWDDAIFYQVALAGDRVAWGEQYGNIGKSNTLLVADLGGGPPAAIAGNGGTGGDPRGTARAGYLLGAGPLLVFGSWAYCDDLNPPSACLGVPVAQRPIPSATLWRVREPSWPGTCPGIPSGQTSGRCQDLRTEPGPLRPLDVDQGRIVASGDNATVVLDADGRQLLSVPVPTRAAELAGSDLIVVVPGELRDYDAATGALLHAWPLPYVSFGGFCGVPADCGYTQFRLEDAARGLVTYIAGGPRPVGAAVGGQIHLLRLADGRDVVLDAGTAARFGTGGLFYAYQAPGAWPGRIRFVPFDQLPLR